MYVSGERILWAGGHDVSVRHRKAGAKTKKGSLWLPFSVCGVRV
jgi:hypothetical protein